MRSGPRRAAAPDATIEFGDHHDRHAALPSNPQGRLVASASMFRAEVIGSLLRPAYLDDARRALRSGRLTASEFKRVEDRAVDHAIATQEGAGVDVVTDGEMRRGLFADPLTEAIEGIEPLAGGGPLAITGRLQRRGSLVVEEYSYARSRARRPLKVTVPSPLALFGLWSPAASIAAYTDPFAAFADAATILRREIEALVGLGCMYVQVDAPELATLLDPRLRDWAERQGFPAARLVTEGIELINATVSDIGGVRRALHLCRHPGTGTWTARGGYESFAAELFQRASAFDTFLLEYDGECEGTFAPLAGAPDDRRIVLGLVSTRHGELETREDILGRIDEAARYFPREQLALSTQCGFAWTASGHPVDPLVEERKLRLVAEMAHDAWAS
jgi:5-methyltetrahydropteroyltriglutamate--homocysteine methyltransferase